MGNINDEKKIIRVGSRKSELALIQTKHVIALLQKLYPHKKFEIHTMSTIGDRVLNISLPKIGEKSLFTRDLEDALRNGGVDFVVHSLKDLPTSLPTGMAIGAVLEREDARDALVLRENYKDYTLKTLPKGCVIGTSSLRRTAQLKRLYPQLTICDIRGNLNTRLAKLDAPDSKFSGIILAQAGLVRMGWMNRISQVLEPDDLLYAVGQGALAVECRANDNEVLDMLRNLMCLPTTCRILAERSFLKTLGGGCSAPVAVVSNLNGNGKLHQKNNNDETQLSLEGAVWSLNGQTEIREHLACTLIGAQCNNNNDIKRSAENGRDKSGVVEGPPQKRNRPVVDEESSSSADSSPRRRSPPVINDDIEVTDLGNYDLKELIERHIDLAKKCPIVGADALSKHSADLANGNVCDERIEGGGDADRDIITPTDGQHCPLQIDVGQDFMGQCPFVDNETKVIMASAGKCPITGTTLENNLIKDGGDEVDHIETATTSKCPFAVHHQKVLVGNQKPNELKNNNGNISVSGSGSSSHAKCPFLQKTVELFDYDNEEKPLPRKVLIEKIDDLFCGLYHHQCYSQDLYVKSHRLGQELAENLIKKGALEIMKAAQAEIHSKIP